MCASVEEKKRKAEETRSGSGPGWHEDAEAEGVHKMAELGKGRQALESDTQQKKAAVKSQGVDLVMDHPDVDHRTFVGDPRLQYISRLYESWDPYTAERDG